MKQGPIVVKIFTDHLHTASVATDLMLRYENVFDELKNLFAYYHDDSFQKEIFLFVCGYQDNRIRIFDLA